MILTRESVFSINTLRKSWQIDFLQCFGEERMFMQKEVQKADIFRSAIIDGTIGYAQNSMAKRFIAKLAGTGSGQSSNRKKL